MILRKRYTSIPSEVHYFTFKDLRIPYIIEHKKIKNSYIRIYPGQKIIVSIPLYDAPLKAQEFIMKKASWVYRKISAQQHHLSLFQNGKILFSGEYHDIIKNSPVNIFKIQNKAILIPKRYKNTGKALEKFYKEEGLKIILLKVKQYSELLKVKYRQIKIKKMQKWGYCKRTGEIAFNIILIALPEKLIDYIIFHELSHLIHFNHSHRFKNFIKKQFPDQKKLDKDLKNYHLSFKKT